MKLANLLKVGTLALTLTGCSTGHNGSVSISYSSGRLISTDGDSIPEVYIQGITSRFGGTQVELTPTEKQINYFAQNFRK